MRVFYADVYFLINFTTDFLSLYLSCRLLSVGVSRRRLAVSSAVGSLFAVGTVLAPIGNTWKFLASGFVFWFMVRAVSPDASRRKRWRLGVVFLTLETLIGGAVYSGYILFGRMADWFGWPDVSETENQKILRLAVLLLLAIGALRFLIAVLEPGMHERTATVEATFEGRTIRTEALVDTGNLCRDPMDGTPVVLIKAAEAEKLFPKEFADSGIIQNGSLSRLFRLIPIREKGGSRLLNGIRMEKVKIILKNREENVRCVVAVDQEGGTYGGYAVLLPAVLTDHVG